MTLVKAHLPCPDCGSSDGLAEYDESADGPAHTYCYVCTKWRGLGGGYEKNSLDKDTKKKYTILRDRDLRYELKGTLPKGIDYSKQLTIDNNNNYSKQLTIDIKDNMTKEIIDYRGLTKDSYNRYKVHFLIDNSGTPFSIVFPYGEKAQKIRLLAEKKFYSEGEMNQAPLFGQEIFPTGKYITITEGELDAISCYQMNGGHPAVSVRSSASARRDCERAFNYLNSFERIYLCFDNDEPGQKALAEVAGLFNPNKVYHVKLGKFKDANEYLQKGDGVLFQREWWAAKPYLPKGIVGDYSSIEDILSKESNSSIATYPFHSLQSLTYGIRSSELILFTAQEKVGKTEVMRSIEYHLLDTTDYNLGIIHLEEEEKRSIQGLAGYRLDCPAHLPDSGVSNKDVMSAFKDLTKRDSRCFFYSHFGSDDPQIILDTIRYLVVVCHCKFIFLDHITMLVTGYLGDQDERKTLDHISTQLAMMTRELDFTLFLVSHVNDDGKTRGSRNISKVADLIVHLDRDIEAETIDERNKTYMMVKGNRYAGLSGPAGVLWFDPQKFRLREIVAEDFKTIKEAVPFSPNTLEGTDTRSQTLRQETSRAQQVGGSEPTSDGAGLQQTTEGSTTEELGLQGVEI